MSRITSKDSYGNQTSTADSTFETLLFMTISIDLPADGEMVYRPNINVVGTVNHLSGEEFGVKISSDPDVAYAIPAQVNGNTFFVNNLPLAKGSNAITAIATDANGNVAQTDITVTSDTVGQNWLDLFLSPENGVADPGAVPAKEFPATLRVKPYLQIPPGNIGWSYAYTYSGNGTSQDHLSFDNSSSDGLEHQLTFHDPGNLHPLFHAHRHRHRTGVYR